MIWFDLLFRSLPLLRLRPRRRLKQKMLHEDEVLMKCTGKKPATIKINYTFSSDRIRNTSEQPHQIRSERNGSQADRTIEWTCNEPKGLRKVQRGGRRCSDEAFSQTITSLNFVWKGEEENWKGNSLVLWIEFNCWHDWQRLHVLCNRLEVAITFKIVWRTNNIIIKSAAAQ